MTRAEAAPHPLCADCANLQQGIPSLIAAFSRRPNRFKPLEALLAAAALPAGASLLEVGCSYGDASAYLAGRGYAVTAIDADSALVAQATARHPQLRVITADATALPFSRACFDCVVSEAAFSVIPDKVAAAREYHRVLHPGGKVLLTDFALKTSAASRSQVGIPCLDGVQTMDAYSAIFEAAGFHLRLRRDDFFGFAGFVSWLCREYHVPSAEIGVFLSELYGTPERQLEAAFTQSSGMTWCQFIFEK